MEGFYARMIIANVFIAVGLIATNFTDWIIATILGVFWLIFAILSWDFESKKAEMDARFRVYVIETLSELKRVKDGKKNKS